MLRILANAGAMVLCQYLRRGMVVGLGVSRTITTMADFFSVDDPTDCTFTALAGGIPSLNEQKEMGNIVQRFASLAGGKAVVIHAPFIVSEKTIAEAIVRDETVHEALEQARHSDIAVFSVGPANQNALLYQTGTLDLEAFKELEQANATGDIIGQFFDENGKPLSTRFMERVVGLTLSELAHIPLKIAIAGGEKKYHAILAALRGNFIDILCTDILTAEWLLAEN